MAVSVRADAPTAVKAGKRMAGVTKAGRCTCTPFEASIVATMQPDRTIKMKPSRTVVAVFWMAPQMRPRNDGLAGWSGGSGVSGGGRPDV
jgi:hypothetical protein